MIIPEHKIVFLHIPKTGGSSVGNFLFKYYNIPYKSFLYFTQGFLMLPSYKDVRSSTLYNVCHLPYLDTLRLAKDSNIIVDSTWNIFTVVRNPYYRTTSAIFFQPFLECKHHMHTLSTLNEKRKLFKKAYNTFFSFDPHKNDYFSHRLPQHYLLETEPGKPLYKMYKYEEGLENILRKTLNLPLSADLDLEKIYSPEYENSPKTNYSDLFTRDFIKQVNEYYYEDFEFCGYEMWDPLDFPE
jgi:hypothetical protein